MYKRGRTINNIPIISFSEFKKTHNKHKINELILAIKNIESVKKKKILQYLSKNNIKLIDGINFLNEKKRYITN